MQEELLKEARAKETPPARLWELARSSKTLALAVAANPAAPEDLLVALSSAAGQEEAVRAAVAKHPNTPLYLLRNLWPYYPESAAEHPYFGLLLLEGSAIWRELPRHTLLSLLRALPKAPWGWAAHHTEGEVRSAVAENPAAP